LVYGLSSNIALRPCMCVFIFHVQIDVVRVGTPGRRPAFALYRGALFLTMAGIHIHALGQCKLHWLEARGVQYWHGTKARILL
jgi:hypothetical protein